MRWHRHRAQAGPRPDALAGLLRPGEEAVDRAADSGAPVIAGPWLGEVGYELLYWVPFLTRAVERRPELGDRLHVVSRGGTAPWYAHLTRRYVDAFTLMDPAEVMARRGKRSKQVEPTAFEEELVGGAARALGLERWTLLHPAALYGPLLALSRCDATPAIRGITRHRRLVAPDPLPRLPERYVAVRFYFSAPLPDDAANRAFAGQVLRALAERLPVVVLNTGLRLDDHVDAEALASERVLVIDDQLDAATNLAVQTAAVAHAEAFVGTYGGLSYLAPMHGVPAVAFYSHRDQFLRRHLELAHGVFAELDAPYVALPTTAASLMGLLGHLEAVAR